MTPGADPASLLAGIPEVSAAASPNPLWLSERQTPSLASIKANAQSGTPLTSGPSANIGQTISLKGGALAPGVASFPGYNGTPVTSPLTSVKVGKKGKAVVPQMAITGGVSVIPDGGEPSTALPLQIVPTISSLSATTVAPGDTITITGTGFDPQTQVIFPGVAQRVTPSDINATTAVVTVPDGVQKGKMGVATTGGTSSPKKIKVAAGALANRVLATDEATGLILVADDVANTLSAIDPATGAVVRSVDLGIEPSEISFSASRHAAVVLSDELEAVTVDLDTWEAQRGRPAGLLRPGSGVDASDSAYLRAIDPRIESLAYVSSERGLAVAGDLGRLYVLDYRTGGVARVITFDGPIEGVTVGLDGRAYTVDRATGRLLAVPIE